MSKMTSRTNVRADEPDALVPDKKVREELGISVMTLWRLDNEQPDAKFPPPIRRPGGARKYRSRKALEAYKAQLMRDADLRSRRARAARSA